MKNAPEIDRYYWLCLICASVFGANAGDFLADSLDLGHLDGIPYLLVTIAAIFIGRRFAPFARVPLYWAAIAVIRAAATNIGDVFHDVQIGYLYTIPVVIVLLIAWVALWRSRRPARYRLGDDGVDGYYWIAMFTAGVLGTLIGDCASYPLRLGNFWAMVILAVPLVPLFFFSRRGLQTELPYYWLTVVFIRSSGTAAGDLMAHSALGLNGSTLVSGAVYIALIALFYGQGRRLASRG